VRCPLRSTHAHARRYVMREQSHALAPACLAYSPDAQHLASGASDSQVPCCPSTMTSRAGESVVRAKWALPRHLHGALFRGDGRAVDAGRQGGRQRLARWHRARLRHEAVRRPPLGGATRRYVNFRTLVCDRAAQLSCLAVDASGEVSRPTDHSRHRDRSCVPERATCTTCSSGR